MVVWGGFFFSERKFGCGDITEGERDLWAEVLAVVAAR